MEKCNAVTEGRTPCKLCQGGHSEYVCESCRRNIEKSAQKATKLDPEAMAKEHK